MRIIATISIAAFLSLPAHAQGLETMEKANQLGTVIAAEAFCGLTFDQAAIQAWIAANIKPSDMEFAPTLNMMVTGSEYTQSEMSPSAKTAHCAAVAQSAKHFGFTK